MKRLLLTCLLAALLGACGQPAAPGIAPSPTGSGQGTPSATQPSAWTSDLRPTPTVAEQRALETPAVESKLLAANRQRVQPATGSTRTSALVGGLNDSAFDLYRSAVKGEEGNLIYSPYSIAMAFSMVYAGARGETEAQMAEVLGFLPREKHHPSANALERHIASLGADASRAGEGQGEAFRLNNANAVWGQQGYPFLDAYLRTLAEQYGAGVRTVDFRADPERGRKLVNDWVADQTEGHIRDILAPGIINELTRLVLANAVYFKATWLYPFEEQATKDEPFTLLDGRRATVPMMTQTMDPVPYAEGKGYQAIVLPYTGGTAEMVVILPKQGRFEAVEAGLSTDFLKRVRATARRGNATVTMPRFDFESGIDLPRIFQGMGMPAAFRPDVADFSGIAGNKELYISAAIHRATITADEKGTEATAATVIVGQVSSGLATQPVHLTIDRPFIFAIVDRETGTILFLGRVMNPAG